MPLITAAGDGNAGAGPTWVGGAIPAAGDTTDLLGFTVTVEAGHTTNRWDGLVAAGGTLIVIGGLRYRGVLTFDAGDTLDLRPTAELLADCTVDDQASVYPYIHGGTLLTTRSGLTAAKIHAKDNTKRPTYGLYLRDSALVSIDGLELYDCHDCGGFLYSFSEQCAKLENIWVHDNDGYGLRFTQTTHQRLKNICVYSCGKGLSSAIADIALENAVFGKDLDGGAHENTTGDLDGGEIVGRGVVLASTTRVGNLKRGGRVLVADLGHNITDGIITGQGAPGDRGEWQYEGTIGWDGTDYTLTPNNNCSATFPLRCNLLGPPPHCANIPVSADDSVVPSLKAQAAGAALECELWGSGLTLTSEASEIKDCELAETTFSWTGAVRSGGTDRQLPWEFRVREYQVGASVNISEVSAVVTDKPRTFDMAKWAWDMDSAPTEPALAVVNDRDGDAVTATVDGDAAATNTLYYRKTGDSAWTEGSGRSGDGDIAQAGLDDHTSYDFVAVSSSGGYNSVPSNIVRLHVTSGATKVLNIEAILNPEERGAELEILCSEGG